ncbi:hypothetical protein LSM04_003931 [Trypanosoma melophagium]|uniref:uncharacterized protein n=1 Tax=Trypanosoma melophagium TaxID=715481 RepID=UPI00351A8721|nr:hypothetical protein LSM04_003931 [Trypanosoma melophagium]
MLQECVIQLGVMMPVSYVASVWPELEKTTRENVSETVDTSSNVHKMQEYFSLYFNKGLVSLGLLRLFWRSPHGVLAANRESATMGLIASGLTDEK